jgi:hypothetical protein
MAADMVIGRTACTLESIRTELREGTFNSIRQVLPDRAITQACREAEYPYRTRLISPIVTVLHMVLAALWPEESFAASWSAMWNRLVTRLPGAAGHRPSSGSVAKARRRLPLRVWNRIVRWLADQAQAVIRPCDLWHGHRVVLGDGTCASMPDRPALRRAFGVPRVRTGLTAFPVARLVALALMGSRVILDYAVGPYRTSEVALLRRLLKRLRPGDLVILDRLFAAAHGYARFRAQGLEFLTRVHQRLQVQRLATVKRLRRGDRLVALPVGATYRRKDPALPKTVLVRLVRATLLIRGQRKRTWLVTSLLDPVRYPAEEIVALYARRWRIETHFEDLKVALGVDVLRSETPDGIRKELAARVCAANLVRMLIGEAADRAHIDPGQISFIESCRTILAFAPAMGSAPVRMLPLLYEALLAEIASHRPPFRPGRNEPRQVRRDHRRYPLLRVSRLTWRRTHAA